MSCKLTHQERYMGKKIYLYGIYQLCLCKYFTYFLFLFFIIINITKIAMSFIWFTWNFMFHRVHSCEGILSERLHEQHRLRSKGWIYGMHLVIYNIMHEDFHSYEWSWLDTTNWMLLRVSRVEPTIDVTWAMKFTFSQIETAFKLKGFTDRT